MALGKQLPAIVAKRLTTPTESVSHEQAATPITIMGTEGLAVQFAKCCRPIPGDAIVGIIKKDSGLIIHMLNCNNISHSARSQENYLNVTWGKDITRTFEAAIKIIAVNKQGVLARVAAEIAKADSNIDDIVMESENDYMHMRFVLQVNNRLHLSQVIRGLRHLREISTISRIED
jgi:GTP pyrophosphokinase